MRARAMVAAAMIVCVASVSTVAAAQHTRRFVDVPQSKPYYEAVEWATAEEVMAGCSRTRFCPTRYATRSDVVQALHNHQQLVAEDIQFLTTELVALAHFHPVLDCIAVKVEATTYGTVHQVTDAVHDCTRLMSDQFYDGGNSNQQKGS